jgi:hypothetical protein
VARRGQIKGIAQKLLRLDDILHERVVGRTTCSPG